MLLEVELRQWKLPLERLFIDDDPTDREALIANISTTPDKVLEETTQDYKLDVDIWKEDVSSDKINILINSTASVMRLQRVLQKYFLLM